MSRSSLRTFYPLSSRRIFESLLAILKRASNIKPFPLRHFPPSSYRLRDSLHTLVTLRHDEEYYHLSSESIGKKSVSSPPPVFLLHLLDNLAETEIFLPSVLRVFVFFVRKTRKHKLAPTSTLTKIGRMFQRSKTIQRKFESIIIWNVKGKSLRIGSRLK